MTLEQLRIFIAVAEREHLTQAAGALNLTQSAVSSAIGLLESRYAVTLFSRTGRGLTLTDAGRMFLIEARGVIAKAREAEMALADAAGMRTGALTLVASQTVGNYWMPVRMARFRQMYPGITIDLQITNTEQAVALILSGEIDMGVVEGDTDHPKLEVKSILGDTMNLILPTGHPLAGKKALTNTDWAALRFVTREPGSGTRILLEKHLAHLGLSLTQDNTALALPSNEAVCSAVASGLGVSIISDLVTNAGIGAGHITCRPLEAPARRFKLLHLKNHKGLGLAAFSNMCLG